MYLFIFKRFFGKILLFKEKMIVDLVPSTCHPFHWFYYILNNFLSQISRCGILCNREGGGVIPSCVILVCAVTLLKKSRELTEGPVSILMHSQRNCFCNVFSQGLCWLIWSFLHFVWMFFYFPSVEFFITLTEEWVLFSVESSFWIDVSWNASDLFLIVIPFFVIKAAFLNCLALSKRLELNDYNVIETIQKAHF